MEVVGVGDSLKLVGLSDQEDLLEPGQGSPDVRHLALEQRRRGDQHAAVAQADTLAYRLWAEGGEQRTENMAAFKRTQRADVKLGDSPGEQEDALALAHSQSFQDAPAIVAPDGCGGRPRRGDQLPRRRY